MPCHIALALYCTKSRNNRIPHTANGLIGRWESLGTSESDTVGAGNLHNHLAVGYNHTSGNDTQIDVSLTLTNV